MNATHQRVRALRGVCVGPGRHLVRDEEDTVDASTARYLLAIRAVALADPPAAVPSVAANQPDPQPAPAPAKAARATFKET